MRGVVDAAPDRENAYYACACARLQILCTDISNSQNADASSASGARHMLKGGRTCDCEEKSFANRRLCTPA